MNIVLIGRTGSGKTALAKALQSELDGIPVISSGSIARRMSEEDQSTDLALRSGLMAPEAAMRTAVRAELERADATCSSWVLDGFPRTMEQLVCLQYWTSSMPYFVWIDVAEMVCIERLVARGREDDNPDAIARKLALFRNDCEPMLEALDEGGVLNHVVATDLDPAETLRATMEAIRP